MSLLKITMNLNNFSKAKQYKTSAYKPSLNNDIVISLQLSLDIALLHDADLKLAKNDSLSLLIMV